MSTADKLTTIAENQQKVYDAGKQKQYDEFWDSFQPNGSQPSSYYRWFGRGFTDDTLKPKYDIIPTKAYCIFRDSLFITDLTALTDIYGNPKKLDFSHCTDFYGAFSYSRVTKIGTLDLKSISLASSFGERSKIHTIEEVIFYDKVVTYDNTFAAMNDLKNLHANGTINNTISFQWCPLTPTSMKSIISCLKNFSDTSLDLVKSIKFSETCWTELEADSTSPSGGTWKDYVLDIGWNI